MKRIFLLHKNLIPKNEIIRYSSRSFSYKSPLYIIGTIGGWMSDLSYLAFPLGMAGILYYMINLDVVDVDDKVKVYPNPDETPVNNTEDK